MPKELYLVQRISYNSIDLVPSVGNIKEIRAKLVLNTENVTKDDIIFCLGEERLLQKNFQGNSHLYANIGIGQTHIICGFITSKLKHFHRVDDLEEFEEACIKSEYLLGKYTVEKVDFINDNLKNIINKRNKVSVFNKNLCNKSPLFNKITNKYIAINEDYIRKLIIKELKALGYPEVSIDNKEIFID